MIPINPRPDSAPCEPSSHRDDEESRRVWLQSAFDRYQRPLIAYASRLLDGDLERARDCVQDTFLRLCRESRSAVDGHVDAWLFKTCRNRAMDFHRKESRMISQMDSATLSSMSGSFTDPSLGLLNEEQQQQVEQQIAQLPEREHEVLQLRLAHGLTYKQIADITDLSVSHVGVLLHQAITRLRASLVELQRVSDAS